MIEMIQSKEPVLELRGAMGIGRSTYKAPYFCPHPKATITEAKASIAKHGGVDALVGEITLYNCLPAACTNV